MSIGYTQSFVQKYTALVCFFLITPGCTSIPDTYAPPIKRQPLSGTEPGILGPFVRMNDSKADAYVVRDISGVEAGSWRWAYKRPELRFYLQSKPGLKFAMDFSIAEVTFQQIGPVTLSVFINNNLLDRVHCDRPGQRRFEKAVPPDFLRSYAVNLVAIEPDKTWVSKEDGATLGFILASAGFIRQ